MKKRWQTLHRSTSPVNGFQGVLNFAWSDLPKLRYWECLWMSELWCNIITIDHSPKSKKEGPVIRHLTSAAPLQEIESLYAPVRWWQTWVYCLSSNSLESSDGRRLEQEAWIEESNSYKKHQTTKCPRLFVHFGEEFKLVRTNRSARTEWIFPRPWIMTHLSTLARRGKPLVSNNLQW